METLTPYVQTATLILQFVVLGALGFNYLTMWRTFRMIDQYTELIGLFRSEMAYLTMRIEVLEARQQWAGERIEKEGFRGRSHSGQ